MTVEEIRASVIVDDPKNDQFPVGMRVLAVDDDLTCLRVLETLLRRCQYHVTTTNQAILALKMLRENKNKFDLVISDVQMPDMDGFKLLELVGLEMDLPVIMLSGNSDTRLVMKGISHGACDYLLKPVRIEELKNIWQHVVRRRKFDPKDIVDNPEKSHSGMREGGQGPAEIENADQNGKLNRKRKDQNEEEDEEDDGNANENDDPSTQKKPRVVWSVDLHRKFVAAVNHLGIDKAVPKKILDLMNIDGLTRENVASHLQKYRLYLKRISCVATQSNMGIALGGSLNRLGDFPTLSGPGQLPDTALTSLPPGMMLGRLNTPTGLGMRGIASSGTIQLGHIQNSGDSVNGVGKLKQIFLPGNQNGNLLQGIPNSLELDQLQQNKCISHIRELSASVDPIVFPVASVFPNNEVTIGNSNNSFLNVPNNSLMLQGLQQQTQGRGGFGNSTSVRMAPLNSESFMNGFGVSSHFPNPGSCNDSWQSAIPLIGCPSNPLQWSNHPFSHADLSPNNLRSNISSMAPHNVSNPLDVVPNGVVSAPVQDSRRNVHFQENPTGVNVQHDNSKFSNFGSMNRGVVQNTSYTHKKNQEDHKQDYPHNSNRMLSSLNSAAYIPGVVGPVGQASGQSKAVCNRKMNITVTGQSDCGTINLTQHNRIEKSMDTTTKFNEEYLLDQTKSQGGIVSDSCVSFEELMSSMMKQDNEIMLMNEDVDSDVFPPRTCM